MNKFICFIVATLIITQLQAQKLAANFDYSTFHGETPYLETYISVNASTVIFQKKKNDKHQGEIGIVLILTDQEGSTKFFDKYNLLSPEIEDSTKLNFYFIDQQRIVLPEGDYILTLNIVDANSSDDPYTHQQEISFWSAKETAFSSIQLVESYQQNNTENNINKNGIDLNPMASNVFYTSQDFLYFYTELYNLTDAFVFSYYITSVENNRLAGNLVKTKVQKSNNETRAYIGSLPLEKLPSGNYELVCEAKDRMGKIVAKKEKFFYRINEDYQSEKINISGTFVDTYSKEQLIQYIDYVYPIQKNKEGVTANSLLKRGELQYMKKFFYQFWKDRYPLDPLYAWENYLQVVKKVNSEFDNGRIPGYKTDRGRVYLQYGPPNSRVANEHSTTYERFEVWHYYRIETQSDCRFVFGNRGTDMHLALSNVEGETSDQEWLMRFGESLNQPNFDPKSPMDYFINPQ